MDVFHVAAQGHKSNCTNLDNSSPLLLSPLELNTSPEAALSGRPLDTAAALPLFVGPSPAPSAPTMPSASLTESLLMRLRASTSMGAPVQRSTLDGAAVASLAAINDAPVFSGTPVGLPPLSVESLLGIGAAPSLFGPADTPNALPLLSMPGGLGLTFLSGALPAGWFSQPSAVAPQALRFPSTGLGGTHPDPSADTSNSIATQQLDRGGSVPSLKALQLGQDHAARAMLVDEASAAAGHGSSDRLTSLAPGTDDGLDLDELFRHFGGNTPGAGTVAGAAAAAALAAAAAVSPRGRPGSPDLKQMYDTFVTDIEGGMPADLAARLVPLAAMPLAAAGTKASRASTPQVPRPQGLRAAPPKKRSYAEFESDPSTPEKLPFPGPVVKRRAAAAAAQAPATRNQALVPQGPITALLPCGSDGVLGALRCRHLFGKIVTRSDVSKLGRIVLPRAGVEASFPPCHDRNGIPVAIYDPTGRRFDVVLKFWMNGRPVAKRMWLLDQCHDVISELGLAPGQQLDFFAAVDGRLVLKVWG